jgi:hypothetical protein
LKTAEGGSAVSDKGKQDEEAVGGGDDKDEEGLLIDEGIFDSVDNMLVGTESTSSRSLDIFVSHLLPNHRAKMAYYVIVIGDTFPVWYVKTEIIMKWMKYKCKIAKRDPEPWMDTFREVSIRRTEHAIDTLYKRRKPPPGKTKGSTVNRIMYVVPVPLDSVTEAHEYIHHTLNELKQFLTARPTNGAGAFVFRWAQDHSPLMIENGFKNKKGKTNVEIVRKLNSECHEVFSRPMNLRFHTHLDKFLVDNDIKGFLIEYFDANSWDDISQEVKKAIYRNYPNRRRNLPVWDEIEQESYN